MKRPLLPFCLVLVCAPVLAQSFGSFPPVPDAPTPTYANAEVVRVNGDGTATIRTESGDAVLTADLRALAGLRPRVGEKLLIAFDTVADTAGRQRRVVTYARPASPTSGQPGPSFAAAGGPVAASTVRVISTDRANRTITVTDMGGVPLTLPVSARAASGLAGIRAGDVIGLDFASGGVVSASALPTVSAFQTLPAGTGVGSFVVPPLNGQFVGFDAATGMLTVQTANGRRQTFPVATNVGSGLGNLRPGDNLSLGFQITQEANRARVRAGGNTTVTTAPGVAGLGAAGGSTILSVGNVQTLNTGQLTTGVGTGPVLRGGVGGTLGTNVGTGTFSNLGVTGAANVGGAVGVTTAQGVMANNAQMMTTQNARNLAAVNAQGGAVMNSPQAAGVPNAGGVTGANQTGIGAGGFSPVAGTTANQGVAGTGATAGPMATGQAGAGTFNNMGAGLPFVGGGFATPSVGPGSPFASNVPSVPTPSPVMSAVLPPATAKAPLSDEEVGLYRAYGERDLDAAAMVLAMVANDIDAAWFRFKMACLGGFIPETSPGREWFLLLDDRVRRPTDDQCRMMYSQLHGSAAGFETQLGIALDAARRADVLPGRVREILERHRIER